MIIRCDSIKKKSDILLPHEWERFRHLAIKRFESTLKTVEETQRNTRKLGCGLLKAILTDLQNQSKSEFDAIHAKLKQRNKQKKKLEQVSYPLKPYFGCELSSIDRLLLDPKDPFSTLTQGKGKLISNPYLRVFRDEIYNSNSIHNSNFLLFQGHGFEQDIAKISSFKKLCEGSKLRALVVLNACFESISNIGIYQNKQAKRLFESNELLGVIAPDGLLSAWMIPLINSALLETAFCYQASSYLDFYEALLINLVEKVMPFTAQDYARKWRLLKSHVEGGQVYIQDFLELFSLRLYGNTDGQLPSIDIKTDELEDSELFERVIQKSETQKDLKLYLSEYNDSNLFDCFINSRTTPQTATISKRNGGSALIVRGFDYNCQQNATEGEKELISFLVKRMENEGHENLIYLHSYSREQDVANNIATWKHGMLDQAKSCFEAFGSEMKNEFILVSCYKDYIGETEMREAVLPYIPTLADIHDFIKNEGHELTRTGFYEAIDLIPVFMNSQYCGYKFMSMNGSKFKELQVEGKTLEAHFREEGLGINTKS